MFRNLILIVVVIILFGCRKEISIDPTSTVGDSNTTAYLVKPWRKISWPDFNDVRCFAVFQGELYAGGGFENSMDYDYLVKIADRPYSGYTYPDTYTGDFQYIEQLNADFNDWGSPDGIFTLKVIGDKLYLGGDYRYGNDSYDLMYIDQNHSFKLVDFLPNGGSGSTVINFIGNYNNDPIICGNFTSNTGNSIVTNYIEKIQNNVAVGMADLNGVTYGSEVYHDELYVVGSQDQIVKWNGSSWESISYPGKTLTDKVYSVKVFNDELYFLGDFAGNVVLKKYSESGGWSTDISITSYSVPNFSKLQVFDGHIFIIGKDFTSENKTGSIWRNSIDGKWQRFGNLTSKVYDVILYSSKYFAAVEDGIYLY